MVLAEAITCTSLVDQCRWWMVDKELRAKNLGSLSAVYFHLRDRVHHTVSLNLHIKAQEIMK